jgi:hypothetical protein
MTKMQRSDKWDSIIRGMKETGLEKMALDICHDRALCRDIGIKYTSPTIYQDVVAKIKEYEQLYYGGNENGERI